MRVWAGVVALLAAGLPALAAAQDKPPAPTDTGLVERISLDDLKKLLAKDKVLVVDVRSAEAYGAGHIPGAVSAPLPELEKHLPELKSAKKPIVTYCA